MLDDFVKELERRGHPFVRYADDFLVFTKTEAAAKRVFTSAERYLTRKLKLVVNRQKSRVRDCTHTDLGILHLGRSTRHRLPPVENRDLRITAIHEEEGVCLC